MERSHWLDDGSLAVTDSPTFDVAKSLFYRQELASRDLHLQLPGEIVPAKLSGAPGSKLGARLPWQIPVWEGLKACVVDLNGGGLRVAGGATFKF